jgi:hypothetical protein
MDEPKKKRAPVEREEWAKRVERWRDSGLTTAEFAAELGVSEAQTPFLKALSTDAIVAG